MSKKTTTQEFIEKSKKIHGNRFDYSKTIYGKNNKEKVIIICKIHGEFLQIPNSHLLGIGCSKCSEKYQPNTEEFILKAKLIHGDEYDYSSTNYISALKKINIICKKHGKFSQTANGHLNGAGCIKCGIDFVSSLHRKTLNQFIEDVKKIHGNRYDYSKCIHYKNNRTKLEIICPIHGSFFQSPHDHLSSFGCPKCKLSKGEQKIISFLDNNRISYISQKTFNDCKNPKTNRKLSFDFYIPSKNLLIEYDGNCHYTSGRKLGNFITTNVDLTNTQYRDTIKTKYCKNKGINLLRIKYTKFKQIDKILNSMLVA